MESPREHRRIFPLLLLLHLLLLLLLLLQPSVCLLHRPAHRLQNNMNDGKLPTESDGVTGRQFESPDVWQRKLLQTRGAAVPFPPLQVFSGEQPCLLFQARKLALRYDMQKVLDLTERLVSPHRPVDTRQSVCGRDRATLVLSFGDVEDLRDLSISLQLSNTFYESSARWWFSLDAVSLRYNSSEEAVFNASEVYAPAASSYRCAHVSSLQRYSALLLPGSAHARRWAVTFIDLQIQAFNVTSARFSPASDCSTLLTPAILMGLVTSLILLLVLAYALHMVVHLKHIEHEDERKPDVYYPHEAEQPDRCCLEEGGQKHVM